MAPTFCNRCGDSVEEGCDPRDELAELDALLERLKLKRYDLTRKINRLHTPILRQLPSDVTSTIFEFCLPYFTDHPLLPYPKEQLSIPLSLGAICSYWRDIAWSTPRLWSSLVVRVPSKYDSHMTTTIVAKEWLDRSGQLPLSLRIFSLEETYNKTISALANIINQYSSRWFYLDLYIPDSYYQCFHATDNHAPILKSIRFRSLGYERINFQLTCPHLERAYLSFFPMDGTNIQWDNLTQLTLHSMTIIDSFLILRKTPRLVFCRVSGSIPGEIDPTIEAHVLTSLRTLELLITSFAEGFLNNLIAPHLEEFSLPNYHNPSTEVITSFLRRSACSLRSLSVTLPSFYEGFIRLLQSIPSLDSLSILSIYYDPRDSGSDLLRLLAKVLSSQSTSFQQGFLPKLKILKFTGTLYYLDPGNYSDLYSMPADDNSVHGPFHLLDLDIYPVTRIPENTISYLSSVLERGVTVNVSSGSKDILQSSINYYKCRKEALCRDWADNLDSSLFS